MKASSISGLMGLLLILGAGCVERFYPDEEDVVTGSLVVNAHLAARAGMQTIQISRSDQLYFSQYIPEPGCMVEVESPEGEVLIFTENEPGDYEAEVGEGFFRVGNSYRLRVVTAEGIAYESEPVTVFAPPAIDSVYYRPETAASAEPGEFTRGLRFFMDAVIDTSLAEFMRWELIETYEFRNPDYAGYIYDLDRVVRPLPDSLSDRQCWITRQVNLILTLDAGNLEQGILQSMPLHFVSNQTQRLEHRYSLLVRQFALDPPAFRYWHELKKNSQELSGIYSRQPSLTPSNICNPLDPEEKVLGFFSVSGVAEYRIFVDDLMGITVPERLFCFPTLEPPRLRWLLDQDLPLYLAEAYHPVDGETYFGEIQPRCLDCRLRPGSSGDPPGYWQ